MYVEQKPVLVTTRATVTSLQAGELMDVEQKPVLLSQLSLQAVKLAVAEVVPLPSIGKPLRIELAAALRQQLT